MSCSFCGEISFLIKKYENFSVCLFDDQRYLGRCIIKLNRHAEDLSELTREEQNELFEIIRQLKRALGGLFSPSHFNYASLGNTVKHLHVQVIPRYEKKRVFMGRDFVDENVGEPPWPYKKPVLSEKELNTIKDAIKQKLENSP